MRRAHKTTSNIQRGIEPSDRGPRLGVPDIALALAVVCLVGFVFSPVVSFGFVSLDDPLYISANPHLTADSLSDSLWWALSTTRAGNWHPLTWLSHIADVRLFGMAPGAHHAVNLALHAIASALLFLALASLTGRRWPSAFVAGLFAVHPLHVESVAWLSERKDVLSACFWMATLLAYSWYVRQPGWRRLSLVAGTFAAGLTAKPMLVSLPFVLLLLDVWPLRRVADVRAWRSWRPVVVEKLPLLAASAVSSVVTVIAQRMGGAVSGLDSVPLLLRCANALAAYGAYLGKTVWPAGSSVFYPLPATIPAFGAVLALVVLVVVTTLAWRWMGSRPYLAVGWLWFLGTLVPVIGIVQVGTQAMADRYTYLPLVGLFIVAAWGLDEASRIGAGARRAAVIAGALILVALSATTRELLPAWENSETLWRHALAVQPDNYYAQNAIGLLLREQGRAEEARGRFQESVRQNPRFPEAHDNLGLMLAAQGLVGEAIAEHRAALALNPALPSAHNNLGVLLARTGRPEDAIQHYRAALVADPENVLAHENLGLALAATNQTAEALEEYAAALRLDPRSASVWTSRGLALDAAGRHEDAVTSYTRALTIQPGVAATHNNLAAALVALGRTDGAIAEYQEAVRLDPSAAEPRGNLGILLASQGRVADAIPHFQEATRLKPGDPTMHLLLATAYGASGRFSDAADQFRDVLRLDPGNERAKAGLDRLRTGR